MGKTQLKSAIFAAAIIFASACVREDLGAAKYGLDQCRRVALVDAGRGDVIRGAEDFAYDAKADRLFISAYDRRATEKAARRKANVLPQGGIYAVFLDDLFTANTDELMLSSLAAPGDFSGGLRPHGISFDQEKDELVFVNRIYKKRGRIWEMSPRLQRIGANGEVFVGAPAAAHCAANDVAATGAGVFTSFDHASCGLGGAVENVFRLKHSGVSGENGQIFARAAFANGIAETANGDIAMAATRESAILLLASHDGKLTERNRIALPGRPDNLTISSDGDMIVALHTSMSKLTAARKFGLGKAPSRIVRADEGGEVTLLLDDPMAEMFSAATVAIETERGLVAGSVLDEGLLVCQARL